MLEYIDGADIATSDTGISLALGLGYRITTKISLEAGYTLLETDIAFVGLTSRFSF